MKIISNFVDYYDYVANQYGGGDPAIRYQRTRLLPLVKTNGTSFDQTITVNVPFKLRQIDLFFNRSLRNLMFKWLVVNGKYYLVIKRISLDDQWVLLNEFDHPQIFELFLKKNQTWYGKIDYDTYMGTESDELVELSKLIKTPVFYVRSLGNGTKSNWTNVEINSTLPILGNIKMQKLVPAEQMYQDIAYFISNKMVDSPDLVPPVTVSDKDRIVQHGFDLVTSFRHRK